LNQCGLTMRPANPLRASQPVLTPPSGDGVWACDPPLSVKASVLMKALNSHRIHPFGNTPNRRNGCAFLCEADGSTSS
jgi:hypothetical protein